MAHKDLNGAAYRARRKYVIETYDTCFRCGLYVDKELPGRHPWGPTYDHAIPRARGGSKTSLDNARLSHNRCNSGYRDGRALKSLTTRRVGPQPSGTC
jgi:5-methylcytosine-specific restriction endonuclease McrA